MTWVAREANSSRRWRFISLSFGEMYVEGTVRHAATVRVRTEAAWRCGRNPDANSLSVVR